MLVQALYNVVDSIFVARLSEQALTAVTLAFPLQNLMIAVSSGTGVGVNAILSKSLGEKRFDRSDKAANSAVLLAFCNFILFFVIGFFFAGAFIRTQTDNVEIAEMATTYLRIVTCVSAGIMYQMMFERLLQSTGKTVYSMISQMTGAVINIILDPIMIFGMFGCPAMGIKGAAYATVIGQWVSFFAGLYLNIRKNKDIDLLKNGFVLTGRRIAGIYRVGLPTIIMNAMNSMMVTAVNAILLPFSSTAVAFFGIYYKLQNFLFMPMNGLGQAAIPTIAYNYGARNKERIMSAAKMIYVASAVIALIGTVIFRIYGEALLGLFNAGEEMTAVGVPALHKICLTFIPASFSLITGYAASGLGDGMTNMTAAFLRQFVPLIPCAYLLASTGGIEHVWYAFWISEAAAAMYCLYRLSYLKKTKLD
jgi:putative MATE family efflux protein